jgi:SNF2 family DNA or RNA helicase
MPAILGDQMGLGKTFQAIAMLAYLKVCIYIYIYMIYLINLICMSDQTHLTGSNGRGNVLPRIPTQIDIGPILTVAGRSVMPPLQDNLNVKGPHLVVVPLSVLSNWMIEFERFCPSMRCVRFHGPKVERTRIKVRRAKK